MRELSVVEQPASPVSAGGEGPPFAGVADSLLGRPLPFAEPRDEMAGMLLFVAARLLPVRDVTRVIQIRHIAWNFYEPAALGLRFAESLYFMGVGPHPRNARR